MTALDKIEETKFFLDKIVVNERKFPDVQYYFSAFLSSSHSIADHLLQEYSLQYKLEISFVDTTSISYAFKTKAKENENNDALTFFLWFKIKTRQMSKMNLIGSILTKKRHVNTHRKPEKLSSFIDLMYQGVDPKFIPEKVYVRDENGVRELSATLTYTDELGNIDVKKVCEKHLEFMKNMVNEAHSKFPNQFYK